MAGWRGLIAVPSQRVTGSRSRASQGHSLRTAGCVISNGKRSRHVAGSARSESHVDGAIRSRRDAGTAVVGLAKVGGRGDACKVHRSRAVIGQCDGQLRARGADELSRESQAGR